MIKSKTKQEMKDEGVETTTKIAIEYFYNEHISAMKKAGFSDEEIKNNSYVKHLKDFLALEDDITEKYLAETKNAASQKKNRASRLAHETEIYLNDPKHLEEAVAYFVKEQKDAMKKAGFSDKQIAGSSYIKNLPTFLKMDEDLVAKYVKEKTNPDIQAKERAERLAHEKEVYASQKQESLDMKYTASNERY